MLAIPIERRCELVRFGRQKKSRYLSKPRRNPSGGRRTFSPLVHFVALPTQGITVRDNA